MGLIQLIGSQGVGQIDGIEPTLGLENRVPIISVVVQQGLEVRFVVVGVRLWADECSVESDADLFEEGVRYVVHQVSSLCSCCISSPIGFLQFPFDFEVTAREIDEIFLRIDLKIYGVDARGERIDGNHAITHDAEIGRGNPKEVQHGVLDPRRAG